MKTRKEESGMLRSFYRPILIGLVIGAAVTLAVLLLLAVTASSFDIPPAAVVPLATLANALGAFGGGLAAAAIGKRNGWLLGLLTAFFLFLLTTAAGFGLYTQVDGMFLLVKALIMLACGMVGGMFAVNSGKRKHR